MRPRIAIPYPHSNDTGFSQRSFPQYAEAVRHAGGDPVEIGLDLPNTEIMRLATICHGVLLPGSVADVSPEKYGATVRHPKTAAADPARDNVDELLIQDAYNMRKPLLAICFGIQILNVWRTGTLIQHLETNVRHTEEKDGEKAPDHLVRVDPQSRLGAIYREHLDSRGLLAVNTSHHQAIDVPGDGLRVVARSVIDSVIEAVEGTAPDHWIVAVQWHPERMTADAAQRALFSAFVQESQHWHERLRGARTDFETVKR